jgi:hypothetical protein
MEFWFWLVIPRELYRFVGHTSEMRQASTSLKIDSLHVVSIKLEMSELLMDLTLSQDRHAEELSFICLRVKGHRGLPLPHCYVEDRVEE